MVALVEAARLTVPGEITEAVNVRLPPTLSVVAVCTTVKLAIEVLPLCVTVSGVVWSIVAVSKLPDGYRFDGDQFVAAFHTPEFPLAHVNAVARAH